MRKGSGKRDKLRQGSGESSKQTEPQPSGALPTSRYLLVSGRLLHVNKLCSPLLAEIGREPHWLRTHVCQALRKALHYTK